MPSDPVLEVHGLDKSFGGEHALAAVDLIVRKGEIHALLGENGAGKSTLIKVLAGALAADGGDIVIGGQSVPRPYTSAVASACGLAFVHQDLGLIESLSVAENMALQVGYERRGRFISQRRTERAAGRLLEAVGAPVSPRSLVGELRADEKVMVAIARALSQDARVVVLDEISSSLPAPEVTRLLDALAKSRGAGLSYIYVTHRLEEVFAGADRITVLRDGRTVASADVVDVDEDQLATWILGRTLDTFQSRADVAAPVHGVPRLRLRDLFGPGLSHPVDLDIESGEVVALCGLLGSGARSLARLVGGAVAATAGTAELDGEMLPLNSRRRLGEMGCAYVPGDRVREGAIAGLSIRENFFAARLRTGSRQDGFIRRPAPERSAASRLVREYAVRPQDDVERPLATLSGGNQQKVVFGRAMRGNPRLIVLDDATAGVDVGARVELHHLLERAVHHGSSILLASTDFTEVARLAHRALVMRNGRIVAEFTRDDVTEERLATASLRASGDGIQTRGA